MAQDDKNQQVGPSQWGDPLADFMGRNPSIHYAPATHSSGGAAVPEPQGDVEDVDKNVPVIHIQHDGKTYDLADIVKGQVKNMYREGTGDVDELLMDAFERAAKSWDGKSSDERMNTVVSALRGEDGKNMHPIAEKAQGHWAMQKVQGGDLPPDPLGEGQVAGKTILYIFRCYQQRGRIDWDWIKDDAKAHGHRQIHDIIEREMSAGNLESGGVLVPSVMAADLIPYLEDQAVVRRLGARTIEMPNGNLDFGRMNSTVVARWLGETGSVDASRPGFDEIRMVARKLRVTVIASNDLIRQSPRGVAELISSSARSRTAAKEDLACLRGTGQQGEPKGIYEWVDDDQKFNQSGTDLEDAVEDAFKAIRKVAENNHAIDRGGWVMPTRTKYGYMSLTDADGNLTPLTEMLANDELFGFPVGVTNGLPTNLGGGSDETETYFGDFSEAMIGETLNMQVEETQEATVSDEDGNPLRLWDEDQRALRLIHEMDFALRYSDCFSVIEKVTIGA